MKRISILIATTLLLIGCIKEYDYNHDYRQRLVVEGRIEEDAGAIVALSLNIEYRDEYDKEDIEDMVVRWAKVSVEHNGHTEVLTGRRDNDYPTQFIYTGSEILGIAGEDYRLIVEYSGNTWQAECMVPQRAQLEDIRVTHERDTLYSITATLPPMSTPCMIECSMEDSHYYAPTILGIYNASESARRITINRPLNNLDRSDYTTLFTASDVVSLRLSTMDDFSFDYWSMWENNLVNIVNPLFPAVDNLPTNISNNGLGIWAGYGSSYHHIGLISEYNK